MAQTLILAKDIREANHYARVVGMKRGTYRAVSSASSIRGVRRAEVHLLSSFTTKPNRHAIMSVLRHARTLEVIYVDFVDGAVVDGGGEVAEVDGGELVTDEMLTLAFRANSIFSLATAERVNDPEEKPQWLLDLEVSGTIEPEGFELSDDPEVQAQQILESAAHFADGDDDAAPVSKRRTRCKDCEELFHANNPAEAKLHEHAAPVVKASEPSWTF